MATINVGGMNPFGKRCKTLEEAINSAMDNDTIRIHKRHVKLENGVNVNKSLYIEGGGATISVGVGKAGLNMQGGNLHIKDVNFELGMQNNGIVFAPNYFGKSYFTNVNFEHGKTRLRETFPSISAMAPKQGVSGIELEFDNCRIDNINVGVRRIKLNNCTVGKFYKNNSTVIANSIEINNLKAVNTYFSSGDKTIVDKLTTPGQLVFNGSFVINNAIVTDGKFDKGNNKEVTGKAALRMINEFVTNHVGAKEDIIFTAFGEDKYTSSLVINNINYEAKSNAVKRLWFNLKNVNLTLKNSNLPRLDLPSVANNGSIGMENTEDFSDWQVNQVQLSNKGSRSQLFSKSVVKKGQETDRKQDQEFGALAELDSMIGLKNVKKQIHQFVNRAKVNNIMRQRGMNVNDTVSLHMVLAGNAGTGKTQCARLIGKALYENGILKTNKFTEVQAGDLVAGFVGQTAEKTRHVVEEALDGVLFIDEAYALTHEQGNSFKDEAVAELLKDIDDHRDRIVCILAGYTPNMRKFFAVSNPGLKSRFANWIDFPDYTPVEMLQIMGFMIKKSKYHLADKEAALELRKRMMDQMAHLDIRSGNGRFVRNALEKITDEQKSRIGSMTPDQINSLSNSEMLQITKADVVNGMKDLAQQQMNMNGLQGMGG